MTKPFKSSNGFHRSPSYPYIKWIGKKYHAHCLIFVTWVGERKSGMEIDHINGVKMDCRAVNLELVTAAENRKRYKILCELRANGMKPNEMEIDELKRIFKRFSMTDPLVLAARDIDKYR